MTEWTFDEESLFGMLIVDFFLLGGISGQIYGSPNAEDGDFIETSPIKDGPIENGYVVETVTGSRYFLSPGEGVKATNLFDAFKDMALKRGGTITIPKDSNEKKVGDALNILSSGKPRSTFSLFDLWQGFGEDNKTKSPASNGLKAPNGVPMLSGWNTNKNAVILTFTIQPLLIYMYPVTIQESIWIHLQFSLFRFVSIVLRRSDLS